MKRGSRAGLAAACLGAFIALACLDVAQAGRCGSTAKGGPAQRPPAAPRSSVELPLPPRLSQTGLYVAGSTSQVAPENLPYTPQYPLWSDGASKRRWIWMPKGTRIDASNPDDWQFPVGTRFWKEFSFGERTETRYLERWSDGSFRYATYVWDAALADAFLAPSAGQQAVREIQPGTSHDVPSNDDCRACHEGRRSAVLGFNALQLSTDRDPLAPHREAQGPGQGGLDLAQLAARDLIAGLPDWIGARPPSIAAPTARARAAAGYLFGNCAHCHNRSGPLAALDLDFDQSISGEGGYERMLKSVVGAASRYRMPGQSQSLRVQPGKPEQSALWFRMQSRFAAAQMPPLGTKLVDREATTLLARWIALDVSSSRK